MGLFDLFKRATQEAPGFGTMERRRGAWLGTISLGVSASVPLEVAGPHDRIPEARLQLARELMIRYDALRPSIQAELYEHYRPYLETPDDDAVPAIHSAPEIWDYVAIAHVRIEPVAGIETVEIGFDTTWDVEHTPAARFQEWRLVEFNGSVQGVY